MKTFLLGSLSLACAFLPAALGEPVRPRDAGAASATQARPLVVVCRLEGVIHPAAADFVKRSLSQAEKEKAALLILEISTPGGLMSSMRDITSAVVNSRVPVATFVYPSGARAASAGFFILLAGDLAAMAPGTNAGSAHPVGMNGEDIPKTMNKKIEQDALAQIRTLCAAHHRGVEAAEKAVSESLSYTETEAKEKGLIEMIARDPAELCEKIDGRRITRTGGASAELRVKGARLETLEMGAVEKALGIVSEPQIASILFLIGVVGIYFEFSHPGAILPGVAGAVALVLALYALSVLPVNFAGLGLIVLGLFFFLAEVKVSAHGMLAFSGIAAFVAGFLLLFAGNRYGYTVDIWIVLPAAILCAGGLAALSIRSAAIRRRPARTGPEGMIGETGRALSDLAPDGKVMAHGEYWDARSREPVAAGTPVKIVAKEGFILLVEALPSEKGGS